MPATVSHADLSTAVSQCPYVRAARLVGGDVGAIDVWVGECPAPGCDFHTEYGTWAQSASRIARHIWYAKAREQRRVATS